MLGPGSATGPTDDHEPVVPGEVITPAGRLTLNARLPVTELTIVNTGPVPVHLTAHFHVFEANPRLRFDRRRAYGRRLDLPVGGSVRFEPGEARRVRLVPIGGERVVRGFSGLVDGPLDAPGAADEALQRVVARGYLHEAEDGAT